ncbi:DUF397 domain-containing protein [Goodfellowiella coeruleoviolacea]|uniref:DUF397 domain-containing protein n=1 Tax=Goodfellowiella coeruleoviolacea TaxID=334858 RepID=A0AAE3GJL3_9PSEU|nr:DUF397 domain-containing protein [Goodfellowiella coeruleoviolacea]MCP2168474.1 protein of unknown function (DUF397) [Goodfellowiella coeruleoviolacea]
MTYQAPSWRTSSYSKGSELVNCVEVAFGTAEVAVRDSKNADGSVLGFTPARWRAFLTSAKAERLTQ